MQTIAPPGQQSTGPSRRTMWTIGGVLAFASLAAAAAFTLRNLPPPAATQAGAARPLAAPDAAAKPVAAAPAAAQSTAPKAEPVRAHTNATPAPATTTVAQAPVCANCGVVESVHAVQRKGAGTGLGAVAGGVVGAALGNQIGKGNGRSAMTVLGAVGGGFAGNEVEKRARAETVFEVRVRMDDGSVRTIEQRQAPRTGERVEVQGQTLRNLPA